MKNTPAVGELIEIDEEFQNEYIKIKNTKFQSFLEAELTFVGMFFVTSGFRLPVQVEKYRKFQKQVLNVLELKQMSTMKSMKMKLQYLNLMSLKVASI